MNYKLEFVESALKEWEKLDSALREQFKKRLAERLVSPKVPSARLNGMADCYKYKIKLKSSGYRLVYKVLGQEIVVLVVAVGKRERNAVYKSAMKRTKEPRNNIGKTSC
ncbi:MAG: type II toxin-antitoxin system RelE family toxin [Sulfuricella sp.]